jgi:hypothetical protein
MTDATGIGRLAMRREGTLWVAYYAAPDSMDKAIFLGSIRLRFVEDKARKDAFMAMMQDAVADLIEEQSGSRPDWAGAHPAPERERGGSA